MGGISTEGKKVSSSEASEYGQKQFGTANAEEQVLDLTTKADSWIIRASPSNSGIIYIGWDENINVSNGFPLQSGETLTVDVNNIQQPVYAVADTGGDELRYFALD